MKKAIILVLAALAAACSSPQPHFFQPTAIKTAETVYNNVRSTILLNQVLMPAEAARPQITTLGKEDYEVKIDEFNRWGATPERLIQQVLNENLSLYLPHAVIENQTPLRKNYRYAVAVEISEMNGRLGEYAELKASYFIKNKQNRIIRSGKFSGRRKIEGGYDAYVPAQSSLLAELAADIAKKVAKLN